MATILDEGYLEELVKEYPGGIPGMQLHVKLVCGFARQIDLGIVPQVRQMKMIATLFGDRLPQYTEELLLLVPERERSSYAHSLQVAYNETVAGTDDERLFGVLVQIFTGRPVYKESGSVDWIAILEQAKRVPSAKWPPIPQD